MSAEPTGTDREWEEWGRREPYFGVITDPRFRRQDMTEAAKQEFFDSGRVHAEYVMDTIRRHVDPAFAPQSILEYGCGVGRVLAPFAHLAREVVGVDVSPSMLAEARRNCDAIGLENVTLLATDDSLSGLDRAFDLVHSFIVFQHIPVERGRAIFARLLARLRPGGVAAVHFAHSKRIHATTYGVPPREPESTGGVDNHATAGGEDVQADPEMQMNSYPMSEILFVAQEGGVRNLHAEFTDHGGELGVFLFFQKPAA